MYQKKEFKNFFEKVLHTSKEEEPFILEFIDEFIKTGINSFEQKLVVWDEEEIVNYNLTEVITAYAYGFAIPEGILNFINREDNEGFTGLINGFFSDQLLQIHAYNSNQFIAGVLHTDLSLSTLLSLGYFPNKTEYLANHLIDFLEKNQSKLEVYPSNLDFGFGSTLYLVHFLLENKGYSSLAKKMAPYLKKPKEGYDFAVKNLYSKDSEVVAEWVDILADFHVKNSKADLTMTFNREWWQYLPIEIITLLQLRSQEGISNEFIKNSVIDSFLPYLEQTLPFELSTKNIALQARCLHQ